jgi:hypothetical protein
MGLSNRFANNDSLILSTQIVTANNNQSTLNAEIAANDHLNATSAVFAQQSLTRTLANPTPNVAVAGLDTVGAALGGVGQTGTYSEEADGGGLPCFAGDTLITLGALNYTKFIKDIIVGYDHVLAFDTDSKTHSALVTGMFVHYYSQSYMVVFENDAYTITTKQHRYWAGGKDFVSIEDLKHVLFWNNGGWEKLMIRDAYVVKKPIVLYNLTVQKYQTYLANGHGVHNLKPAGNNPFGE